MPCYPLLGKDFRVLSTVLDPVDSQGFTVNHADDDWAAVHVDMSQDFRPETTDSDPPDYSARPR
jgi:hypothetical protein